MTGDSRPHRPPLGHGARAEVKPEYIRLQAPLLAVAQCSFFFFSSRRRHTRFDYWSSDVCSSDLEDNAVVVLIDNPEDLQHVDSVSQALKNRKIKWAVGLRQDILAFLNVTTGEPTAKGAIGTILDRKSVV